MKSCVLSSKIEVSKYLARVASGARLGALLGSILGAFGLRDGSTMASKAPGTAPRRPREPPRRLLDSSRSAPGAPMTPPGRPPGRPRRLSGSPRASKTAPGASKAPPGALQGTLLDPPRSSQEPSRGAFYASSCCPAASSLQPASGLGGMREAITITRVSSHDGLVRADASRVSLLMNDRRGQMHYAFSRLMMDWRG